MSLLSPRVLLMCIAGLSLASCAEGLGAPIYEGMDGSVNGNDDGGGNGGQTNGTTGEPLCAPGTCAMPAPLSAWMPGSDPTQQFATATGDTSVQCNMATSTMCPSAGSETIYELVMPLDGQLIINFQAGANPGLSQWPASVYVTSACGDGNTQIAGACQTAAVAIAWTPLVIPGPFTVGQKLYVHVDGTLADSKGPYGITITASPAATTP